MAKVRKIDDLLMTINDMGLNRAVIRLRIWEPKKYTILSVKKLNAQVAEFSLITSASISPYQVRDEHIVSIKWNNDIRRLELTLKVGVNSTGTYQIYFYRESTDYGTEDKQDEKTDKSPDIGAISIMSLEMQEGVNRYAFKPI